MKKLSIWILLFAIVNIPVYSGTINPAVSDAQYIKYAKKYDCVLRLLTKKNNKITSSSSCVLIADKWIATAAHIFENKGSHDVVVVFQNKEYKISKIFLAEGFDADNIGQNDLALGLLEEKIPYNKPFPKLYSKQDEANKIADIAGWGVTGDFDRGSWKDDSFMRAGTNRISSIEKHLLLCNPSSDDASSRLEFLISHGDSGGGLFIDGELAGINSLVFANDGKPNSSWTDESGHTRISLFIDWINKTIANN